MSQPSNPYDSPESGKPGMSGSTKVILGLGIGCGVLVLLCCGGLMLSGYFFGQSVEKAMTKDPARISELTAQIVTITIPESLPPKMGMDFEIPIWNKKFMTWVVYGDADERNNLFLFQLGEEIGDEKAMETQFKQSMQQSGGKEWGEVELDEQEIVKHTVHGEEARFTVGEGTNQKTNAKVRQVTGTFHGKGGMAMLILQIDADAFTKEQLIDIIHSMQ